MLNFHPLSLVLSLPGQAYDLGLNLIEAAPKMLITYTLVLSALMLLPAKPGADLDHAHKMMNWVALLSAVEWELTKDLLRRWLRF